MRFFLLSIYICACTALAAQETCVTKIFVTTEEAIPLEGAYMQMYNSGEVVITDAAGIAYITHACQPDTLKISYIGYSDTLVVLTKSTHSLHVQMRNSVVNLATFSVVASPNRITNAIGEVHLSSQNFSKLPTLLGEKDIIKSVQFSGGVSIIEGLQGMYVRGGEQEQNLILLDGATVFNPSHVFGFFSVFNGDFIKSARLYSTYIPPAYGGRVSAVLSVQSKPATDSLHGTAMLGLISSKAAASMPITPKSSISVAARKSYLHLLVLPVIEKNVKLNKEVSTEFDFYDYNLRYDFALNDNNSFFISAYKGQDVFQSTNSAYKVENNVAWGNEFIVAQWQHTSPRNWLWHTHASFSQYKFDFNAVQVFADANLSSSISKSHLHFVAQKSFDYHALSVGGELKRKSINPYSMRLTLRGDTLLYKPTTYSNSADCALFFEDKITYRSRLPITIALRINPYYYEPLGYDFLPTYISIEPQISSAYMLSSKSALKVSISHFSQNIHMLSLLSASLPADIWVPASKSVPPVRTEHISFGYTRRGQVEFTTSVFAKYSKNLIELQQGITVEHENFLNDFAKAGKGIASGIEFLLHKQFNKLYVSASYNFIRSLRKFETINNGYWYPAYHDKPHTFTTTIEYALHSQLRLQATWIYSSGKIYTAAHSKYFVNKSVVNHYDAINSSRLLPYHRLDVGVEYTFFKTLFYEWILHASCYNAYNRANEYFLYHNTQGDLKQFYVEFSTRTVSLFPILPSLSLQCNF